jgi:hypothetical protein
MSVFFYLDVYDWTTEVNEILGCDNEALDELINQTEKLAWCQCYKTFFCRHYPSGLRI